MVAKLQTIKAELRRRMHEPVADVGAWHQEVVNGITVTMRFRETLTG